MIINIMDPGLRHNRGHHFEIDLRLVKSLLGRGHAVRLYANRLLDHAVAAQLGALAPTMPHFNAWPYENPWKLDAIAGDMLLYSRYGNLMTQDLRNTTAADCWLWPSIFAGDIIACTLANPGVPMAGCVHVGSDWNGGDFGRGALWWRNSLVLAHHARLDLRIGAIEPAHRYEYLPLTLDERFAVFPIPHDGAPISAPKQALRRIGFFGQQRREKGGAIVVKVAAELAARGHSVVLQDSGGGKPPLDSDRIEILGYVDQFAEAIAGCDLVVLPYQPDAYRSRGSGVLWEALASGVPVVAPFDTAPGRWIEQTGAGTLFVKFEVDDVLRAVARAGESYAAIAAAAYATSKSWPQRHGMERFVDALLE
jgi:glycosyltransferase involved in cell wall biosynthesis